MKMRLLLLALILILVSQESRAAADPLAQSTPGAGPLLFAADEQPAEDEDDSTVLSWITKSGWSGYVFMAALGLFSIAGMTIGIERFVNLTREKLLPAEFLARYRAVVQRSGATAADLRRVCEGVVAPIAAILQAGLLRAGRPMPEVEKTMEDAAAREISAIRSKSRPLTVIGSVAPLVGLLGTVVGMILAFHTTSQSGTGKAELLAEGIYLALLTTAAGLTIAIPCMLLAAYFNARLEEFMRETDTQLMTAMPAFTDMERQYDLRFLPEKDEDALIREPEYSTAQS